MPAVGEVKVTVVFNNDGTFVYTPAANFSGVDGFSYQAGDGSANSDVASVTINVAPINDPPVAVNDEYTTAEDTELVVEGHPGRLGIQDGLSNCTIISINNGTVYTDRFPEH